MTTYYISGPMRGKLRHNADQFAAVEHELIYCYQGGTSFNRVINPSRNFGGDQSLKTTAYMNQDLKQVLEADVLVLLPEWTESEGARREVQVGLWAGKRFMRAVFAGRWTFEDIDLASTEEDLPPRAELLDKAKALITGDRNSTYGPPTQDFRRSAEAANAYGYRGPDGRRLEPHDISILVILIKVSRLMWMGKEDNWLDIAGYAGCGWECATEEEAERLAAERLAA